MVMLENLLVQNVLERVPNVFLQVPEEEVIILTIVARVKLPKTIEERQPVRYLQATTSLRNRQALQNPEKITSMTSYRTLAMLCLCLHMQLVNLKMKMAWTRISMRLTSMRAK